jgi:pilus assembly protein CpaF
MERVRAAGNDAIGKPSEDQAVLASDLKRRVQAILPAETIACGLTDNPRKAENEIRLACEHVFEDDPWFVEDVRQREALVSAFLDEVFGLGPIEPFLEDESITEIMVNASQAVYIEREGRLQRCAAVFTDDEQVRALIDRIIGPLGRRIDESSPMVDARLKQGHRVNAVIPPLALDGPMLTIRKFRTHVLKLGEMVQLGSFDAVMQQFLTWCIVARKNLAVSGGTGSGKTTLLNALSCEIDQGERIVTIEDSAELRFFEHTHVVRLEARVRNAEGTGEVTIRDLVRNALRMRPDRIIVGECRGGEALDMLQAMNTGHDGSLTTLHANSPADAVMRLTTMVRFAADLPVDVIEAQVASALQCIVQTARAADGSRFISDVVEISFDRERRACCIAPLFVWDHVANTGAWQAAPRWFDELVGAGKATGTEVAQWRAAACLS